MERYVAFLRGINLGNRRIKGPELKEHFEDMGLEDVATFRASGNVIFADPGGDSEAKLQKRVEAERDERLGYDVAVFLRSFAEVAAIAAEEPFKAAAIEKSKGKPQVNLLAKKPTAAARKKALALAGPDDAFDSASDHIRSQAPGSVDAGSSPAEYTARASSSSRESRSVVLPIWRGPVRS